ncbi:RagB/SusD family nutrient uptake outer membrane protein [Flavihumibacter sp. CACIAM 22H1]|uniref:RagB/SusD family nutrient uptake outer membrane protein n=1 Tax=Flavihumibacter sp. CACIAM 22H1 TaxID=1812911 RepID=UPI0007A7DEC3|nr:RagB/SusD family nutrient uptake outer membrane protein [Flavihumibacter sp. CACIAM 22H1]KYP15994.1 MAG: hypothetical protein A1D16_06960 [Flavihumibacter sp. CACIAM 22H1]
MKKIIFFYTLLITALCSCTREVLEKRPLDGFNELSVWGDAKLAEGFIYTTYNDIVRNLYYFGNIDDWTDNTCNNYTNNVSLENIDNTYDAGWDQYGRIRKCNLILKKMGESSPLTEQQKKLFIAEAKFLRAITYYYMAQRFGGVMIVKEVLDQNTPDFKFTRSTIQEVYDFILEDLTQAAADLPATAVSGRASSTAAQAFISRIGLQAAAYVPAKKQDYLQMVVTASEAVFGTAHAMDADYMGMFNDFSKGQSSKEIIFGYYLLAANNTFSGCLLQSLSPNNRNETLDAGYGPAFVQDMQGWPDRFPSQNLVDEYEVLDQDGLAKRWNQTSYYTNYTANGGYASDVLYKNRDKRFYATVAYDSSTLLKNRILTRKGGNMYRLSNKLSDWGVSESNYYMKKNVYEEKFVWYSDPTNHHRPIIRLGEVYLNYAEALLQLSAPRVNDAVAAINKTRTVHGNLPALGTLSLADAWTAYKSERRVELAFENDRYWSLLRWAKFEGVTVIPELNQNVRGVDIEADGKGFSFTNISLNGNTGRLFTPRRFLFPVPLNQLQANPNLAPQNTGW